MLSEFFLTPEAFCDSDDGLRGLRACLFPFGNTPVALICQLGKDRWTKATSGKIARIQNQNHRLLAMDLFKKVCDDISVIRPLEGDAPSNELSWVDRAKQSSKSLALDGIIVSDGQTTSSDGCTNLPDFILPDFWSDFGNPRLVRRNTNAQKSVLRSFCAFSDWIIVRMPQIRGGSDDEIVTVKQVVQLATSLPNGYRKSAIEVQFPLSERASSNPGRVFRSVIRELRELKVSESELRVTMLPVVRSFVNREILGGEYTSISSGERKQRARWLMTMNHVAVGGGRDDDRDEANSWNLYSRQEASERLKALNALTPLDSETV